MNHNLRIICNSCGHLSGVSNAIVHRILPDVKNPFDDLVRKYLLVNKSKLVCSKCGTHSCEIEYMPLIEKTDAGIPDSQKRYIDEGIVGRRETRGNRWLDLKK